MGLVINAIPSKDGRIRQAEVRVINEGKPAVYTPPISKMVLLTSENSLTQFVSWCRALRIFLFTSLFSDFMCNLKI